MLSREVIEAQRGIYVKGREEAIAQVNAFNGGIDAMDNLLHILDQMAEVAASSVGGSTPAQASGNGAKGQADISADVTPIRAQKETQDA